MESKLFFFGRFPAHKEVGGVTTFTYNFSQKFKGDNLQVIDFYPAENKKIPDGLSYKLINGNFLLRLVKIFIFCLRNEGNYIFNYSSIRASLFLSILPKRNKSKWVTIFHNGDQQKNYQTMGCINRILLKYCFRKIDVVGYLSPKQYDFFKQFDISNLKKVSPYIPRSSNNLMSSENKECRDVINILISGFPTKIYRLIESIKMLNELKEKGYEFNLHLCLYGFDNEGIRNEIIDMMSKNENFFLYEHLDEKAFDQILNKTDIYLRLNSVDSFGLVVAEAIDKGVIAITTDVCERYSGALLVKVDDFITVRDEVAYIIKNRKVSGQLPIQMKPKGIVSYKELLNSL